VAWRLPGWPLRFVSSFRESERGSAIDMLAACELSPRRELRKRYFRHALDETRHAGLFHAQAVAKGGGHDRTRAALMDAGTVQRHGIVDGQTMFERLGELEFLAFVWVAEGDAVEQFNVYQDWKLADPGTSATLTTILKDEHFHVSYSRAELEKMRKEGAGDGVEKAVRRVRWRRLREGWLRFSGHIGHAVTSIWLALAYLLVVAPFRLLARAERGGWQTVAHRAAGDRLAFARSQG
jgi:hypothetical protein